jgi:hypothetical protein
MSRSQQCTVSAPGSGQGESRREGRQPDPPQLDYLSSNSKVLTTRIRFIGVLVGLNGADSSPPS